MCICVDLCGCMHIYMCGVCGMCVWCVCTYVCVLDVYAYIQMFDVLCICKCACVWRVSVCVVCVYMHTCMHKYAHVRIVCMCTWVYVLECVIYGCECMCV